MLSYRGVAIIISSGISYYCWLLVLVLKDCQLSGISRATRDLHAQERTVERFRVECGCVREYTPEYRVLL